MTNAHGMNCTGWNKYDMLVFVRNSGKDHDMWQAMGVFAGAIGEFAGAMGVFAGVLQDLFKQVQGRTVLRHYHCATQPKTRARHAS